MSKRSRHEFGKRSAKQKPQQRPQSTAGKGADIDPSGEGSVFANRKWLLMAGLPLLASSIWAYWPTLVQMVATWEKEPDYSHGYLVVPIAAFFVWVRRETLPAAAVRPSWFGLGVLAAVFAGRYVAGLYYLEAADGWTIPVWVAGAVLLAFGTRVVWWCLPSIVFLWFMIPLPYGAERSLSLPLQTIATKVSTGVLRILNQPAIAEGHTIWIGEHNMEVEEACSGLRILVGIAALAFAFVLFSRWAWWQKGLALLAAVPIAIAANAVRIVGTALLQANVSGEAAHAFAHDLSGWFMIPLAAAMFWVFLIYLDRLFPLVQSVQPRLSTAAGTADG